MLRERIEPRPEDDVLPDATANLLFDEIRRGQLHANLVFEHMRRRIDFDVQGAPQRHPHGRAVRRDYLLLIVHNVLSVRPGAGAVHAQEHLAGRAER